MSEQRWLSLDGICTILGISPSHAMWLAKKGFLGYIPGRQKNEHRFLEPTDEYKNRLKLGEALYGRIYPLNIDLEMQALLSLREVAQIMGWTITGARNAASKGKLVPTAKVGITRLYSIQTVRDLLFKRQGRIHSKQKDPFLLRELVKFFLEYYKRECEEVPTDLQFAEDDMLQRKMARLAKMPSSDKEIAMRDLWTKVELAKTIAQAVKE